jgi:formylglycine-generating enzyme required for sulfatase activity
MPWPLSQEYNEAIQSPESSFSDAELRGGQAATNAMGMPMPRSGNFADVYEFTGASGTKWAIKCFTRQVAGLQQRYEQIDLYLTKVKLPFMVNFQYQPGGLRIHGKWYPILKMHWVEGFLLNEFVRSNLDKPATLEGLAQIWVRMAKRLHDANLAHADLQHGNVLLVPGRKASSLAVKLIDYDGMWVPALAANKSGEVGHPAYQHPQRLQQGIYNADVDRTAILSVACALRSLVTGGKSLWDRYDNGDNLVFREADLRNPAASALFKELWNVNEPAVHHLLGYLAIGVANRFDQVPSVQDVFNGESVRPLSIEQEKQLVSLLGPGAVVHRRASVATGSSALQPSSAAPAPASNQSLPELQSLDAMTPEARPRRTWNPLNKIGITTVVILMLVAFLATSGVATWLILKNKTLNDGAVVQRDSGGNEKKQISDKAPNGGKDDKSKRAPKNPPKNVTNSVGMRFVWIPPGSYVMGSPGDEKHRNPDEVQHKVTLTKGFYMGAYEVTQEQYQKVMGKKPGTRFTDGKGGGPDFPAEPVSWNDAQVSCRKLTELSDEKTNQRVYRLPTEAEWEYACRAGSTGPFHYGASLSGTQARFNTDFPYNASKTAYEDRPVKVGSYQPNAWGLYDMHGNVWEWCEDYYDQGFYRSSPPVNPKNTSKSGERVLRGGSWNWRAAECRAAARSHYPPDSANVGAGFRVVFDVMDGLPQETAKKPARDEKPLPKDFTNSIGMKFVLVPKGKSWLGGAGGKPGTKEVTIPRDYYLGVYEVMQEEWQIVMGENPSSFKAVTGVANGDLKRFPVEQVSWHDAQVFMKKLNDREKQLGWIYRLPTEIQWEYACRNGPMKDPSESAFHYYFDKPTNQMLPTQANYHNEQGLKRTCKVGSYPPNRLGLYDMHGNVWEWCDDAQVNREIYRMIRGGSISAQFEGCMAANRPDRPPESRQYDCGLRVARVPIP